VIAPMKPKLGPGAAFAVAILIVSALLASDLGHSSSDTGARGVRLASRHTNADAVPPPVPYDASTPRALFVAAHTWPHDTAAFTEGLLVHEGRLIESTGLEGRSDMRDIEQTTGKVRRRAVLAPSLFGEGVAVVGDRLLQLTWQNGRGYTYDATTFAPRDSFTFSGEGWGLTSDGTRLYMSDGSSRIKVISPDGFRTERTIQVIEAGRSVWMLNELEWIGGELWANVYQTDLIARIDPKSGVVVGWVDLSQLLTDDERLAVKRRGGLANGIAFDAKSDRVLVTGKMWPKLFEMDGPKSVKP
jgi:glutaminyl-peptide cyclotransferase